MKLRRILIGLVCIIGIAALLLFAGCSDNNDSTVSDSDAKVVLERYTVYIDAINNSDSGAMLDVILSEPIASLYFAVGLDLEGAAVQWDGVLAAYREQYGDDMKITSSVNKVRAASEEEYAAFATELLSNGGERERLTSMTLLEVTNTITGSKLEEPIVTESSVKMYLYAGEWFVYNISG